MKTEKKNSWLKNHAGDVLSYGGLILCLVVFSILTSGRLWSAYNVGVLIQQVCVYAIVSLGAIFIYSMGYMDISIGAQIGVYSILLIMISNATGSALAGFAVILALALVCGLINGYVSVLLGLPSIVTSIFLMSIFGGVQVLLMESVGINSIQLSKSVDLSAFKSIGANEQATVASGVSTVRWKVLAYIFFGACVAVGAFFLTARTGAAGKGTGNGYAMDIMVALLLGGMPLSGGMKSKLPSALIGSFTYVILSNGLTMSGVDTKQVYVIKAIVFLAVILITCRKKNGVLPR